MKNNLNDAAASVMALLLVVFIVSVIMLLKTLGLFAIWNSVFAPNLGLPTLSFATVFWATVFIETLFCRVLDNSDIKSVEASFKR